MVGMVSLPDDTPTVDAWVTAPQKTLTVADAIAGREAKTPPSLAKDKSQAAEQLRLQKGLTLPKAKGNRPRQVSFEQQRQNKMEAVTTDNVTKRNLRKCFPRSFRIWLLRRAKVEAWSCTPESPSMSSMV